MQLQGPDTAPRHPRGSKFGVFLAGAAPTPISPRSHLGQESCMQRKNVVSAAALLCLASIASTAMAQQALERVEITGSSIRRIDNETASPVQVITQADLAQAGKGTVAEFLQTLTADGQGSVPFTYGRGFSGATSSGISLRGLGANATLVLVNGRRAG
ncbi:TonB-dependent receptor plug domain-containing protein [Roseateles sp.]|uniref:TonB-dependent receptor plug domain-containing protein n=1 Tax=Roseateles sp. TaxID=1971397 RepID=UPI00396482E2